MIQYGVNNGNALIVLDGLAERMDDLRPALLEIGEDMVESVKGRFASATGPDGAPWAPNAPITLERYLALFKGTHKKDGSLSKRGQTRLTAKKPLTGETRALATTINYQMTTDTEVSIGSPMVYAAMQNFGGTRAKFPQLWGDIPARPYLGFSVADRENITTITQSYLLGP